MHTRKIILPTDYSELSDSVLDFATRMAQSLDALLLIVHVSERELHPVGERFDVEPRPDPNEMARLHAVIPTVEGVRFEHRLLHGEPGAQNTKPADVIIRLAEEEQVDLIIMGTHGRSGLGRALMGSVATSVLRAARCGVLVVKPPARS
jgi:universal stress protein A